MNAGEAIALMGVAPCEYEPAVQQAWKSVLDGKDLVASIPTFEHWAEAVLPPALALTKVSDLKLLVLSSSKCFLALSERITEWTQALGIFAAIAKEEMLTACKGLQCIIASPSDAALAFTKLKGNAAEIKLLLVLAWAHESTDQVSELRASLEDLDPPSQVIFLVDEWDGATRSLAFDILDTPVEMTLRNATTGNILSPTTFLAAYSRDACTARELLADGTVEDATHIVATLSEDVEPLSREKIEEAKLLSKYLANIVRRSTNRDFRQAVLTMLTKVQKSSSLIEEGRSNQNSLDEFEDKQLRVGIEALMITHQELVYQNQQLKGTGLKKRPVQEEYCVQTKRPSRGVTTHVKRNSEDTQDSGTDCSDRAGYE